MTFSVMIALGSAMAISAFIPGPSVFAVTSRSILLGAKHGLLTTFGVLFADYVFILFAISGLAMVSSMIGQGSVALRYAGVAYLFWMAYKAWQQPITKGEKANSTQGAWSSSLLMGFAIAIANPKAILFYMVFFPIFIDVPSLSQSDVMLVILTSTVSVGGVLAMYAILGAKIGRVVTSKNASRRFNQFSSVLLACFGILLAFGGSVG
ncbi:LysE family translocator [Vibrio tapetis]|uniref:Threonine efflux protein n=1 Tax=Vibrio tapetis subsp. tapetis TaxID=1671868 RepID=A0A2N8ZLT7_9VIBR|nr:LysE family translocator [Vibrio tapetis]SON52860.1 conserved membrane protein of unknown function [Vibrio tapetis subsp. tapetis]